MTQTPAQRRFSKLAAAINQKAHKLGAAGRVTADDLALVYLSGDRKCAYCRVDVSPGGVSFDHIVPFVKGGSNLRSNIAPSCITCQRGKFTKTPEEWAKAKDMTVPCEVCGKQFRPRWADYQRGYGRTCSRKCSGQKGGESERLVG
jgi:hypothetical protein